MTLTTANLLFSVFVTLSLLIMLLRTRRSGWFFTIMGLLFAAAGSYWTFTLSEKEVADVFLRFLSDTVDSIGRSWLFLLTGIPSSFVLTIKDAITDLMALHEPRVPAVVLLGAYFVGKWMAWWAWSLPRGLVTLALRGRPSDSVERLRAINQRIAGTAGVQWLSFPLFLGMLVLAGSFSVDHGKALAPSGVFREVLAVHGPVFWLGIYVLLIEVLAQIIALDREGDLEPPAKSLIGAGRHKRPSIAHLYEKALEEHNKYLLYWERPQGAPWKGNTESADVPRRVAAERKQLEGKPLAVRRIDRILRAHPPRHVDTVLSIGDADHNIFLKGVEDFLEGKSELLIEEALHPVHLEIVFALCEHHQAEGRMSLIICPDALVDYVEHWLARYRSRSFSGLVQRSGNAQDIGELLVDRSYSYIVVAESDVPTLLGAKREARHLLDNLGFICCLELQELQVSLLRMQLSRLWLRVKRASVRVMVQATGLEGAVSLARVLFSDFDQHQPKSATRQLEPVKARLNLDDTTDRYLLVWQNDKQAAQSVWREAVPGLGDTRLSSLLGLAAFAWRGGEQPRFAASKLDVNKSEVMQAQTIPSVQRASQPGPPLGAALAQAAEVDVETDSSARVVVAHTRTSVLTAVGQFYDRYLDPNKEVLICVSAHRYPLRDYYIGRFRHDSDRSAGVLSSGTQVARNPVGGVNELLKTLHDVLREWSEPDPDGRRGLRRGLIFEKFVGQLPDGLSSRLTPTPGKSGLTKLFQDAGVALKLRLERDEDDTRYYADAADHMGVQELDMQLPVKDNAGHEIGRVPAADVGLSILPQAHLLIKGEEHSVELLESRAVRASPTRVDVQQARLAVHPVLEYEFLYRDRTTWTPELGRTPDWVSQETFNQDGLRIIRHLAFFRRLTIGSVMYPDDSAPLDENGVLHGSYFDREHRIERCRDYQPVLQFRITESQRSLAGYDRTKLAFTLAVVVQDVTRALFPRWSHRLFAVAPAAAPVFLACGKPRDLISLHSGTGDRAHLDNILAYLYPRLRVSAPNQESSSFPSGAPVPKAPLDEQGSEPLNIFLIEDSDLDLGVVRSLASERFARDRLMNEARSYLHWLVEHFDGKSIYHRFGGTVDATYLDFNAARACLDELWGGRANVNHAAPPIKPPLWSKRDGVSA